MGIRFAFATWLAAALTHGVTGAARRQLLEETTAFFEANLK
jgi:hypothetical protein